jgi:hypothetical protein
MTAKAKEIVQLIKDINKKKVFYEGKFCTIAEIENKEIGLYLVLDDNGLIFPVNIYDIPNVFENNPISYDLQVLSVCANSITEQCDKYGWNIDIDLQQLIIPLD